MEIHNLMEDLVTKTVDELFDAGAQGATGSWCVCKQCRMDVACYVLNRLKPEYVLSGRGVAYVETDYGEKLQRGADVASLVKEGWARINATPRPHHDLHQSDLCKDMAPGPVFNIRPIMGRLFNGATFEPIVDANISLSSESGLVKMMDSNWTNPYPLAKNTNGTFTFWPYPVPSKKVGERRVFSFTITTASEGFDELRHFLELEIVSEAVAVCQFSMQSVHRLPDLYVFMG
ncbi:MAG: late competence development ComFB family protein [Spirochaetia bacterium]|jgi:competence protein ComFB|nr:late competence development ComFB family protein [Spirochaetia bacterium]